MKIQLDHICVHLDASAPCRTVSLRLVVDNAEMVTEVLPVSGKELVFPDIYEFGLDELVFASGDMPIDIDFFSMDSLEAQTIGHGNNNMCKYFTTFDHHVEMNVAIYLNKMPIGMVCIRGRITELESCLGLLKSQQDEIAHLKDIYEQLAGASRALEQEAGENLLIAQGQIEKLTKKHNDLVVKYNDLLNIFESKDNEVEEIKTVLQTTEERLSIVTMDFEREHTLVDQLQDQLENMTVNCEREQQVCERQELSLKEHNKAIKELQAIIDQLTLKLHNKNIIVHNEYIENVETTIINNTYIENIINNITNNYITNIIESGDADALRKELIEQLKRYEMLRQRDAKLSKRFADSCSVVQVCTRVRPPSASESSGLLVIDSASFDGSDLALFDPPSHEWSVFDVDRHFSYDTPQSELFDEAEPLISAIVPSATNALFAAEHSLSNDVSVASIMTYGAHGSGKSFTLHGFGSHAGLSYRSLQKLFELLELQKSALQMLKSSSKTPLSEIQKSVDYKYEVKVAFVEVFEDKVYDLSVDETQRHNLLSQIRYHDNRVVVEGLQQQSAVDAKAAMKLLASALKSTSVTVDKHGKDASKAVLAQVSVNVKYLTDEPALESQLWFVDLPSFEDTQISDVNLLGFHRVIEALEARRDIIPYALSPLTSLMQGCFSDAARALIVFTVDPTDKSLAVTKSTLEFSTHVHHICNPHHSSSASQQTATSTNNNNNKLVDMKLKHMTSELSSLILQKAKLEESIVMMKSTATEVVRKFNERNEIIVKHYLDEKELCKQLYLDLEITNQNLKRTIADLRDQRTANERLTEIIRALEKEREGLSTCKGVTTEVK